MKNWLAIDTSNDYLSVAACRGGEVTVTYEPECRMQHSVRLMSAVDETLARARLSAKDCDFFAAVTGPGSFTGIRIGVSAVKGFCAALGKPALGITSFEALAYNAECRALAVVPAGAGYYYVCGFERDKSVFLAPERADAERVRELSRSARLILRDPSPFEDARRADPAAGLVAAVLAAKEERFGDIAAFYLKKSQAEEERDARGN